VLFTTTTPPYLDKTNATAVHAALDLPSSVLAVDMGGAVRSGVGAMRAAADARTPTLVVLSDVRNGLPGGGDERDGGDGAAAILFGDTDVVAELVGTAAATEEFLERWRLPGDHASRRWEERFGESIYAGLGEQAFTDALKAAGVTADAVDHLVITGVHPRAAKRLVKSLGARAETILDDRGASIGNTGTAHAGILLADALGRATPGQLVALLSLADGADALVFRTTDAIASRRPQTTVEAQVGAGKAGLPYATFLTWRGQLHREPPRRPDPSAPVAPAARRTEGWKFAFIGSRCEACGTRHLPPARVCVNCRSVDQMAPERLADVQGTIATFTVDRLAFSLNPPNVAAIVDFDGGGRYTCELTDVDPATVAIGQRVAMTFRRIHSAEGVHNYFWKARPVSGTTAKESS
jgi:hydroxymethylglutaryl-CoA synthase